jgi:putative membrane protein
MAQVRVRGKTREDRRIALSAAPLATEGNVSGERPAEQAMGTTVGLRERLAVQRSALANERTLLAYAQTALVFAVGGLALVQLFGSVPLHVLGWVCVSVGVSMLALGGLKFVRVKREIQQFAKERSREPWVAS